VDALDEASEYSRDLIEKKLRSFSKKLKLLTMARLDEVPPPDEVWCSICGKEPLPVYYRCRLCPERPRFDLCPECKEEKGLKCIRNPDHDVLLPRSIEVEMKVPNEDLRIYVESTIRDQMPDNDTDHDMDPEARSSTQLGQFCAEKKDFFNDIVEAVLGNSYNKFLLAKLYINSIKNKVTMKRIRGSLKKLQEAHYDISDRIDMIYEKDLDARIRKQDPETFDRAVKLLSIVYFARRNLTLDELRQIWCAEETDLEDTHYDAEGMIQEQHI